MIALIIVAVVLVLIAIYVVIYNGLVKSRMYTQEAWSQIDVQLKRRTDLIPNLVNTVKGYAKHEKSTLAEVISLRNQLTQVPSGDHQQAMAVSDQLTNSLKSIFALAESYPDLKANQEFGKLMEELTNTENKIAYSRQLFNSSAASYNMKLQQFPSNIIAGIHHFKNVEFLTVPEAAKAAPTVSFED
ncbi:LemA family protein [Lactiplantibacillus plantarum]|uniref:LemA family protein n=1 Tax=Lactiplantibacillus plantarum TaxID=1590 RepID=UPI001559311B|nr:LemA family protein [Lactiplantibacillus plantarum]MCT3206487.1 LemA family protein [Lactiplantibacillus plantarum]MCT3219641.1 LemA family protein [Lactiplantibacillus plantarum]MCT3263385.1 LemA family protein [Lactiplantibacillus plantarum]BEI62968.1 LemA family protein [Lactiplantibacillus plantarum]